MNAFSYCLRLNNTVGSLFLYDFFMTIAYMLHIYESLHCYRFLAYLSTLLLFYLEFMYKNTSSKKQFVVIGNQFKSKYRAIISDITVDPRA